MIEKRPLKITEPGTATNGSGEITCDSPLPDKLRELERRMSAALSSDRTADQLADLLADSDRGIAAADEYARAEHERALDPLKVPTHTPLVSKPRMRNSCVVIALAVEPHGLLKDRPIIAVEAEHEKAEHHDARRRAQLASRARISQRVWLTLPVTQSRESSVARTVASRPASVARHAPELTGYNQHQLPNRVRAQRSRVSSAGRQERY
jgi:hypothetical protein